MCQNHSKPKNAPAAVQERHPPRCAPRCGSPSAISGAAIKMRTMCWPMRAENSATDSAQSGEISAAAATSQPPAT
jgi:hypothetical protein